jgi:hypothetical protein
MRVAAIAVALVSLSSSVRAFQSDTLQAVASLAGDAPAAKTPKPLPKPVAQTTAPAWRNAGRAFVRLKCMPYEASGRGTPSPSYEGYLAVEKGDAQVSAAGMFVQGRTIVETRRTVEDKRCRAYYYKANEYYSGGDFHRDGSYSRVPRDWNALALSPEPASMVLTCSPSSTLKIFETKSAFLAEKTAALTSDGVGCGYDYCGGSSVSDDACVLDALD